VIQIEHMAPISLIYLMKDLSYNIVIIKSIRRVQVYCQIFINFILSLFDTRLNYGTRDHKVNRKQNVKK